MDTALYKRVLFVLFVLFVIANGAYLHRVPGLLGDEASEGENVFELLDKKQITVLGERSYIGPAIDYLRVPFVLLFGYSALALRTVMFLFSVATFWLTAVVLRRLFGRELSLFMLAFMAFSPAYLLYQRLGWTITLFPFFAFLTLFFLTSSFKNAPLLAGFSAGLGLANHIIFLPTLAGVFAAAVLYKLLGLFGKSVAVWMRSVLIWWPMAIGVLAGFGMQFVVLILFREDQGSPVAVADSVGERWAALPYVLPLVLSGSSYVARYTGIEFAPSLILGITGALTVFSALGVLLVLIALLLLRHRIVSEEQKAEQVRTLCAALAWVVGLAVHLVVLFYVIDRFTLRYFVVFVLGVWALAGLGIGFISLWLLRRTPQWLAAIPVASVVLLSVWMLWAVLIPFLTSGGSTNDFSLGNRTDSAAAFVDAQQLIACLRGAGTVFSENVHIWNRLRYVSHRHSDLEILLEEEARRARWLVHYRLPMDTAPIADRCPELRHFRIQAVVQQ